MDPFMMVLQLNLKNTKETFSLLFRKLAAIHAIYCALIPMAARQDTGGGQATERDWNPHHVSNCPSSLLAKNTSA